MYFVSVIEEVGTYLFRDRKTGLFLALALSEYSANRRTVFETCVYNYNWIIFYVAFYTLSTSWCYSKKYGLIQRLTELYFYDVCKAGFRELSALLVQVDYFLWSYY